MTILDRTHFDAMTAGDYALQLEVVGLFRSQAEAWRGACAGGAGWRDVIHRLKGSARGIGLVALSESCAAAEATNDSGAPAALAEVRRSLDEALDALERFAAEAA